jgi:hypothetical protein
LCIEKPSEKKIIIFLEEKIRAENENLKTEGGFWKYNKKFE